MRSNLRVILIDVWGKSADYNMRTASHSLGLRTIKNALKDQGFRDVHLFPQQGYYNFYPELVQKNRFEAELDCLVDTSKRIIFGISATTDDYFKFERVAALLREKYSEATIVAGGPHFKRERLIDTQGKVYRDPVEIALYDNLADAVVVGHASPFIDLICAHEGKIEEVKSTGLYYLSSSGQIMGKGRGRYPRLSSVPFLYFKESNKAEILFGDSCGHDCGFCSVDKTSFGFSETLISAALQKIYVLFKAQSKELAKLHFLDSNPFEGNKLEKLFRGLNKIDSYESDSQALKIAYLDPSLLLNRDPEKFCERVMAKGFHGFYVGRDVVDAKIGEKVGANYYGRPKTQEQLDEEQTRLLMFINTLKRGYTKPYFPFVQIYYIVTPFESKETMIKMLEETEKFKDFFAFVRNSKIPLVPYPGTKVRRDHIDFIAYPERFDLHSIWANPWSSSLGAPSAMLDELVRPLSMMEQLGYAFRLSFREVIDDAFAGRIDPVPDCDKQRVFSEIAI